MKQDAVFQEVVNVNQPGPKPSWLRRRLPAMGRNAVVDQAVRQGGLHTVCEEAHCPNQMECYGRGEATFLLLGPNCTRRCTFCAVEKNAPAPLDPDEPQRIARAVAELGLAFCVLTMVTRDDLPDGGAEHVAQTIQAVRQACPGLGVEVLISDLGGSTDALLTVLETGPEVLNHNVETVPRLYGQVRPQADYRRSIELLARTLSHRPAQVAKSGLMLGLGETREEVCAVMEDLRRAGCLLLTLGQYLAPSNRHHPVVDWVTPETFESYKEEARKRGFVGVASAPYVRSSYQAGRLYEAALSSGRVIPN
ncbi:MAG: lipoyl synthase [Proteobacteria bacterium]|nr:lipoyl synthase [Pseudomonadota bacterium]